MLILYFLFLIFIYMSLKQKEFTVLKFIEKLQSLLYQLSEYLFFDDYTKRKDITETKKCRNCLRRISSHWNICPFCKTFDFQFY